MAELSIMYQNVRGLRTKFDDCFAGPIDCTFEVIALSETWLGDKYLDFDFFPKNFYVYRNDRVYNESVQRGGGALISVRSDVRCSRRLDLETLPQRVWVEVCHPRQKSLLIACHYMPSSWSCNTISSYFVDISFV